MSTKINAMKPFNQITGFLSAVTFMLILNLPCRAQVVVDRKNLNDDKDLQYIQVMYYVDRSTFKPVFYIDYGLLEPEYIDILEPERDYKQKISINGQQVNDRVTVVWLLNNMHLAGWEYIGDVIYVHTKIMDDWHVYTLRRRMMEVAVN